MDQGSCKFSSALIHSIVEVGLDSLLIHRRIREYWVRYVHRVPTAHREIRFVLFRMQIIFAHSTIGLPEATKYFPTCECLLLLNSRCQFLVINSVCRWWLVLQKYWSGTNPFLAIDFRTNYYCEWFLTLTAKHPNAHKVAVSTPIQLFFAWRVWLFTKSKILPVVIAAFAAVSLGLYL